MSTALREQLWSHNDFSELLAPLAYDPDNRIFLMEDGYIGFGFVCMPLPGTEASIEGKLNVLLNEDWPKDSYLQLTLWTSPDIERYIRNMKFLRRGKVAGDSVFWESVSRKGDFFTKGTQRAVEHRSNTRIRNNQLIVTTKVPIQGSSPTEDEVEHVSQFASRIYQNLDLTGFAPQTLDNVTYVRIMNTILNWDENALWRLETPNNLYDPQRLLRDQVLDFDSSVEVDPDGLWLGDKRVSVLSAKRTPDYMPTGAALNYLGNITTGTRGIRDNTLINATIYFPDPEDKRNKLEAKRQVTNYQAFGPLLKFVPELKERKEGFDVLHQAISDGDRPVEMMLTFCLFSDSKDDAISATSSMRTYFREMGFQLMPDKYFCLPLFLNALPFGADPQARQISQRYQSLASRHAVPMLPVFADWKGTGTPAFQLVSRNGQLMNVSLYDSGTNKNGIIAAQSGSGKSFLTNELLNSYLSMGAQAWVIDVGYSYLKTAQAVGGDYMQFGQDTDVCLDPFDLVEDYNAEADMLAGLIALMAAPTEPLSDFQMSQLKRALNEAWSEYGRDTDIDHIENRLLNHDDRRVQDLGHQLYPFTTKGEYGGYFNGRNNIQFDNALTVLELEELKGREHLQQVVLLQLIYQIQQQIYMSGDSGRPSLLIVDEAWDLLAKGNIADFIKGAYRRFRKYGASAVIITQSVNDLYETPGGLALAENSANMYLLGQKEESIRTAYYQGRLSINEGGLELLKSVHTVPGAFSEIFLITEAGMGVGRLIVDRFNQLLFTTDPDEKAHIKKFTDRGYDTVDAIEQVMQEEGSF